MYYHFLPEYPAHQAAKRGSTKETMVVIMGKECNMALGRCIQGALVRLNLSQSSCA